MLAYTILYSVYRSLVETLIARGGTVGMATAAMAIAFFGVCIMANSFGHSIFVLSTVYRNRSI